MTRGGYIIKTLGNKRSLRGIDGTQKHGTSVCSNNLHPSESVVIDIASISIVSIEKYISHSQSFHTKILIQNVVKQRIFCRMQVIDVRHDGRFRTRIRPGGCIKSNSRMIFWIKIITVGVVGLGLVIIVSSSR